MRGIELILYNKFRDDVIGNMEINDMITREQIKYKMNLDDLLVDKLLWYIKRHFCKDGFNKNSSICQDGFRLEFNKTKKGTSKMYIIRV